VKIEIFGKKFDNDKIGAFWNGKMSKLILVILTE